RTLRMPSRTQERPCCIEGRTKAIRPPTACVNRLKAEQMRELSVHRSAADCHEDHRVPLCAGGHPSDPRNLWPQPLQRKWRDADEKQLGGLTLPTLCPGGIMRERARE